METTTTATTAAASVFWSWALEATRAWWIPEATGVASAAAEAAKVSAAVTETAAAAEAVPVFL